MRILKTCSLFLATLLVVRPVVGEVVLEDGFDDGDFTNNPTWVTAQPEFYTVENGELKVLNGGTKAPISVKLGKPLTGPVEVAFEIRNEKASGDGHWVMISLVDSETGAGYSVAGCNLETMFGHGENASGMGWGGYGEISRAGVPGVSLNKNTDVQEVKVRFNPEDQKLTVERDGEVVLEDFGNDHVTRIDQVEFRVSGYPNGPNRLIDNVRISSGPAE